ncbi:hypothetical protein FM104_04820 [Microbacterium esteraromaticum]|uniref:Uncharacterized protein n=1 Tax=Microbacterium esteraromaticum TaxID=57043 RepID=A0A1R4J0X0_9MICO|nr:hypothetical protein [Microbacterium esteraromaticum]SJN25293.1 hypothetical protein FM104_04820 [Microbacterium esteraromaticum]
MARRSLRDRNAAAIAHDFYEPVDAPAEQAPVAPAAEPVEPAAEPAAGQNAAPQAAREKKRAQTPPGDTDRLGIYLTPAEFNGARAGYLADWTNGGEADTFARWIAAALDAHAARTPKQRAAQGGLRVRSEERTGSTRSFNIPTVTMKRMRAAITADQQAGRWPSDSAWAAEAIGIAIDEARAGNGGTLPTPPERLPNRLVR